jgi:hypothetical protein
VLQLNWRRSDRPVRLRNRVQLSHFFLCALRRAASLRDTQTDWRLGGYRGRGMPGRAGYGSEGAVDGGGGGALCPGHGPAANAAKPAMAQRKHRPARQLDNRSRQVIFG